MASPLRAPLLLLAFLALASATTPKQGLRLMGGIQDADAQEQGVKDALDFAMTEYNKASNDAYHGRALQVLKARKQVSVRVVPQPSHGCGPLPPLRAPGQGVVCICWDLANACASHGRRPPPSLFLGHQCVSLLVYSEIQKSMAVGGNQTS